MSKAYTVFRDGDVLAAKITPCWENGKVGQAFLNHSIGVGSTEFHVLRPKGQLHARYLMHFLRLPSVRAAGTMRMTGSAGQKRVPAAFLRDLRIPLPSLSEQRRIATILDHADKIRAMRREVVAHLGVLKQSIFQAMFGNNDRRVEFASVIRSGPTNGLYRPSTDYGSGTPILRIDGFDNGSIHPQAWKRVRVSLSELNRFALSIDDIVVNRVNALSHLGKSALVDSLPEPSIYESNMMRIRLDLDQVTPRFVISWLQTDSARRQVLSRAKKSINQASINQADVKSLVMPLPPLRDQVEFAARVERVDSQRRAVQQMLQSDNELFAALQYRAFRGEL